MYHDFEVIGTCTGPVEHQVFFAKIPLKIVAF
jgi:hypothetical protein